MEPQVRGTRTRQFSTVAVGVALLLLIGLSAWGAGRFADDDGNVHEGNIEAVAAEGITRGCNPPENTLYCPTDPVPRGQMAAFLRRAFNLPESVQDWFIDDQASIFEGDINALAEAGITKGCNPPRNSQFCPDGFVTRGQMAAFLRRAFDFPPSSSDLFVDDGGSVFEADINSIAEAGTTKGCNPPVNNRYCPDDLVLRDQMASFLARGLGLDPIYVPPPTTARSTRDRPDDAEGPQVHFMYVLPSDGKDREFDFSGVLHGSIESFQGWLANQTGGHALQIDAFHSSPDITFHRLKVSDAELASNGQFMRDIIERELADVGALDPDKIYGIYYDGSGSESCGTGAWPPAVEGQVAVLFLRGRPPGAPACDTNKFARAGEAPGYLEFVMFHEILHTLGFVQTCAPNHHLKGHVSDSARDLMWAGNAPWDTTNMELDVGSNDYFDHGNTGCADLRNHPILVRGG